MGAFFLALHARVSFHFAVAASIHFFWYCIPACFFFSNPFFLEKKKWVRGSRKRTQRKPFEKVSSGHLRKQRGRGPFETPGCTIVPRKDFCSAKMLCGGRVERFAARYLDCQKSSRTKKIWRASKRVLSKTIVTTCNLSTAYLELLGFQKGRSPFVLCATAQPKQLLPGGSTR